MLVVDADVHTPYPSAAALRPHLSERWQEFLDTSRFQAAPGHVNAYPPGAATTQLAEAALPPGSSVEANLSKMQEQVLSRWKTDYAILNTYYGIDSLRNPDLADALTSAVNDWLVAEWLSKDTRVVANMQVQAQYPELAAREIERIGHHPGIVGIFLPARSERPYGNRSYYPMFEAAERLNLVVSIHFGGMSGNPPTSVGWPTYYFEHYVNMTVVFQSQISSMVVEGVFQRFPKLRVALNEGGWTWLPSLFWRLDKEWRGLRRETPWVDRLPSEIIRQNVRASLEPIDAPPKPGLLLDILEQIGSEEFLMFSTDYPHNHGAQLDDFLSVIPTPLREKIMGQNAAAFYNLTGAAVATK